MSGLFRETFGQFMLLVRSDAGVDSQLLGDPEPLLYKAEWAQAVYERFVRRHDFPAGHRVCRKDEASGMASLQPTAIAVLS